MKSIINFLFSAFVLCAFAVNTNAQIEFGGKAGVNFTNFSYSSDINFGEITGEDVTGGFAELREAKWRTGFHAGVYALLDIGALSLQPEILWSQKGVKEYSGNDEIVLNYLSIPVMVGFQPFDFLHLQVGPEFSFLMSNNYKFEGQDDREIDDWYATSDLGLAIGTSIDWPGPGLLSIRYVHGLSGVQEDDVTIGTDSFNNRNRTIQASLAFPIFTTEE